MCKCVFMRKETHKQKNGENEKREVECDQEPERDTKEPQRD